MVSKNRVLLISVLIVFCAIIFSCGKSEEKGTLFSYRAINDKDTALLRYTKLEDNRFFGQYEIMYGGSRKDSGEIRGIISGDTLKGSFYYHSYGGGVLKRYPVAMLKRENKWLLGKGIISVYMGIPSFLKTEPIDYSNPEFIFEEVKK
ncbi:hypothetical protein AAGV33_13710 [Flavobacterium sp. FBOR7N2.3]|uniref:Lipoprotein n=1 Tax=Flavobacterium magnesitis TaxID=3138077 RepID=A0ABV4TQ37_9FLAO